MNIFEKLFGWGRTLARDTAGPRMLAYNRVTAEVDYFPQVRINGGGNGCFPLFDVPVMVPGNVLEYQPIVFEGGPLAAQLYFTQTGNPSLMREE